MGADAAASRALITARCFASAVRLRPSSFWMAAFDIPCRRQRSTSFCRGVSASLPFGTGARASSSARRWSHLSTARM